tara:strand:+ start:502 stop:1110 length:609 start_codon:yes stop_codon:yes gene_type:complete
MYKIAAFIKFNKKIEKKIYTQKKNVKKIFGKQIYLDHPVHLTLFTLYINKISELRNTYSQLKVKNKTKPIKIKITSTGVFLNDPLTKGHTLFFNLRKNIFLNKIQMNHLKIINKNIKIVKKDKNIFKDTIYKKNYNKYGFPFVGKIWIPHVTVASIKKINSDHLFIKNFLKIKVDLKDLINSIEFYKIIKNKHYFLFKTKYI